MDDGWRGGRTGESRERESFLALRVTLRMAAPDWGEKGRRKVNEFVSFDWEKRNSQ